MGFNFKNVEVPKEGLRYVRPGFWTLAPVKAELVKKDGGNSHIAVTFEGNAGKLVDKFWLTEKAIARLQYLHMSLYGKKLEKDFGNDEGALTEYFNTLFSKKNIPLNLIVGGSVGSDGKVYANLPYLNFVTNDEGFSEGEFEVGSPRYNDVVKASTSRAPMTDNPLVPAEDDKMPWD